MFVYMFAQKSKQSKHTVTVLTDFEPGLHPICISLRPVCFWQTDSHFNRFPERSAC